MKIDGSVFLCVCRRQVGGTCHRALKYCHFHQDLLGAVCQSQQRKRKIEAE